MLLGIGWRCVRSRKGTAGRLSSDRTLTYPGGGWIQGCKQGTLLTDLYTTERRRLGLAHEGTCEGFRRGTCYKLGGVETRKGIHTAHEGRISRSRAQSTAAA